MPSKSRTARTARSTVTATSPLPFPGADPYGEFPGKVDTSTLSYGDRTPAQQAVVAKAVAEAKSSGASGKELRATFGLGLTGPMRRKVLRDHALASPATIARSYGAYRDGDARKGSQHAREHGPNRSVPALPEPKVMRRALRDAGASVPRSADRLADAYRALTA